MRINCKNFFWYFLHIWIFLIWMLILYNKFAFIRNIRNDKNDNEDYSIKRKNKENILLCEPLGGFGNKIRVMVSCYRLSKILNRKLLVLNTFSRINCSFSKYFYTKPMRLINKKQLDEHSISKSVFISYRLMKNTKKCLNNLLNYNKNEILIKISSYHNFWKHCLNRKRNITNRLYKFNRKSFNFCFHQLFQPTNYFMNILNKEIFKLTNNCNKLLCLHIRSGYVIQDSAPRIHSNCLHQYANHVLNIINNNTDIYSAFIASDNDTILGQINGMIKRIIPVHIVPGIVAHFTRHKFDCNSFDKILIEFWLMKYCNYGIFLSKSSFSYYGILRSEVLEDLQLFICKKRRLYKRQDSLNYSFAL